MMNMKKTLALLLAVVMVIGMIPFGAMAEEADPTETTAPVETTTPVETDPITPQSDAPTDPIVTDPTDPVVTDPTDPVVTDPTDPVVTDPTDPVVTDPTDPVVTDPTDPVVTDPTDPVVTDPTDPVVTDPTDPTETEPTEPEMTAEEVESLYNAIMACVSDDEVDALLADVSNDKFSSFLTKLPAEQFEKLDAHLRELISAEHTGIELPETAINYSKAAPFGDPVVGKPVMRLMRMMSPRAAGDGASAVTDNGLELRKNVSGSETDGYKLTLEAWATGAKTITSVSTTVPTDIILVLDQSGSMNCCMYSGCTDQNCDGTHESNYNATYDVSPSDGKEYYLYSRYGYSRLYYCSECDGWYTRAQHWNHQFSEKYIPKTSESDNDSADGAKVIFYVNSSEKYEIRIDALKEALGIFINNVATKAKGADGVIGGGDDVNHRIAVVGFSDTSRNYTNTELFVGATQYGYNRASEHYSEAFQSMDTSDGVSNVNASIGALDADGSTYVHHGLELANGILDANPLAEGEKRNRVIIVFTDGVPGYSTTWSDDSMSTGNSAIAQAKIAKDEGVIVYAVGIFEGADPSITGTWNNSASTKEKANYYMQNMSSNNGVVQDPSYYLSANNSETLNNIFETISDNIEAGGSTRTLTGDAVIKDVITEQFELPAGVDADDIKVYTAEVRTIDSTTKPTAYTWKDREEFADADVSISRDRKTVSVDNFHYSENWVGTETKDNEVTIRGKKLIIEIPIEVREGFLGGNGVLTNGEGSGVYENIDAETPIEEFVSPNVDIQIKDVTVTAPDYNVYLLGGITADQLKAGLTVTVGNVALDMDADNFGLESWQNAYVTIGEGDGQSEKTNLVEDTTYSATVTVTPTTIKTGEGVATEKTGSATGKISVWVPSLTYKDTVHDYMSDEPNYDNNKVGAMTWVHEDDVYNVENMFEKTAPKADLSYAAVRGITEGKITSKDYVPVNVTAKIGVADITSYVDFNHAECSIEGITCEFDTKREDEEFWLHVINVSADLKIVKKVTGTIDTNQPFVFIIQGVSDDERTKDIKLTVSIQGAGEVIIHDLPIGTYTVTEDTSWAWRFNPSYTINPITLVADADNVVTISNTRKDDSWINDFSAVVKNTFVTAKN